MRTKRILIAIVSVIIVSIIIFISVKSDDVMKLTDPLSQYEKSGEQCLEVDDTIERGDCFQKVGEEHLTWFVNEDKKEFYFPYQHEQDHWNDIFYMEINDEDQLSDLMEEDYFDEYVDPKPFDDSNYARGKQIIDEHWYIFSNLIPKEYREELKYVYLTDTADDNVFAVGGKDDDIGAMILMFGHLNPHEYIPLNRSTLIHEFGHILTLNETQINIEEELSTNEDLTDEEIETFKDSCDTIYGNRGCAKEDSYLNSFYVNFWENIIDTHQEIDWDEKAEYEEFFFKHEDHFFNSYQGTNISEDIAESFTFFIQLHSDARDKSDIKYQKIDFFYDYDELIELRTSILESLYTLIVEDGEFY